ncbi:unnamed protein product [Gulo gulo]|uniref:Uncharacterized protein n=1 Tax=Gulo gulo TaxID=48420 RepID=A0A9X9Q3G2_GULGU|nr:unnamed protein product [Gulo gulo]
MSCYLHFTDRETGAYKDSVPAQGDTPAICCTLNYASLPLCFIVLYSQLIFIFSLGQISQFARHYINELFA